MPASGGAGGAGSRVHVHDLGSEADTPLEATEASLQSRAAEALNAEASREATDRTKTADSLEPATETTEGWDSAAEAAAETTEALKPPPIP